jgi:hypothetical protein
MEWRFGKREFLDGAPPVIATQNPEGLSPQVQGVLGKKLLVNQLDLFRQGA